AYNDDSGRTYSVMILTAMAVSMVVPEFIPAEATRAYSVFTIIAMVMLYAVFLRMQTGPHSYFFSYRYPENSQNLSAQPGTGIPVRASIALLASGVVLIGVLAEVMSKTLGASVAELDVPVAVPAIVVAFISASPEILTALRAALANRMQAVVNI